MIFPFYQSHDGADSRTDSKHKWERLRVPDSLAGKSVLDIGCNEGLITSWLAQRGAARVIGIDADQECIEFARDRYGSDKIQFLCGNWSALPDGPFDLVLWTSAMHYEKDPATVLAEIRRRLAPGGVLILECGYLTQPGSRLASVARPTDVGIYPTYQYLTDVLLRDFSIRQVAEPEVLSVRQIGVAESATEPLGDPVPRGVFHCSPRGPDVMFAVGKGQDKMDLVRSLARSADKVVSIDDRVSRDEVPHYAPEYRKTQFVDWLSQLCAAPRGLIVVEGDLADEDIRRFMQTNPHCRVWVICDPA